MTNLLHSPPVSDDTSARRAGRYRQVEWLRSNSERWSARSCLLALGASVSLAGTAEGVVHVGGVKRCGSPWACPVCAPKIGERRAVEIDQAISAWLGMGGRVYFVTATLRHELGDHLSDLLEMLQGAWSRTFRFGSGVTPPWYGGQARAVEITHGGNGWHPHVHAAVFVEAGWEDQCPEVNDHDLDGGCVHHGSYDAVRQELVDLGADWAESVRLFGGYSAVAGGGPGWDVREVHEAGALSNYLTKVDGGWGAGLELARLDLKRGKGRTPFALLAQAIADTGGARALFRIYERATAGRNRIVISRGLMRRCAVELVSDDEAAVGEAPVDPVAVVSLSSSDWRGLLRAGFAADLVRDVGDLAAGRSRLWPWPPDWLLVRP